MATKRNRDGEVVIPPRRDTRRPIPASIFYAVMFEWLECMVVQSVHAILKPKDTSTRWSWRLTEWHCIESDVVDEWNEWEKENKLAQLQKYAFDLRLAHDYLLVSSSGRFRQQLEQETLYPLVFASHKNDHVKIMASHHTYRSVQDWVNRQVEWHGTRLFFLRKAQELLRHLTTIAWLLPHLEMIRPSIKDDCLRVRKLVLRRRLHWKDCSNRKRGRPVWSIMNEQASIGERAWKNAWQGNDGLEW